MTQPPKPPFIIRLLAVFTKLFCQVDQNQIDELPMTGPCIIYANHINFSEVPVIASLLGSRPLSVLAKEESWKNPLFAFIFNRLGGIPIKRGVYDRQAIDLSLKALKENKILFIAPEGTRSGDGKMHKAHPGLVLLAARSGVPLIPLAHFGAEHFWENIKQFKKTKFNIRVGRPIIISQFSEFRDRHRWQYLTDKLMIRLAELLPAKYHGYYENLAAK